jgi:endonuclease/exonuclease/phosphatase (EEP) superfamily protein YafD
MPDESQPIGGRIRPPQTVLGVALICLAAALAAQGGRSSVTLDLVAQLAPIWLAGSAVAAVAALWVRRPWRLPLAAAAGLGLAASGSLILPEVSRPAPGGAPAPGAARLRIIQINEGGSGLRRPDVAADWLSREKPDLIFVDDPDPGFQAAIERRGFFWRRGTAWTGIASRNPSFHSAIAFSAHDWATMPDLARALYPTVNGPSIELIAVHLHRPLPGPSARDAGAVRALEDLSSRYDRRRLIIAGDFNLTPWSFGLRRLDRRLGLQRRDRAAFSWPARLAGLPWPLPILPIDHLYAGAGWRTVAVKVGPAIGATHYPLVVDLEAAP